MVTQWIKAVIIALIIVFGVYLWSNTSVHEHSINTISSGFRNTEKQNMLNWTVLVTVSTGFQDIFENWWHYFKKLNLSMPVIMVAEDIETFTRYHHFDSDMAVLLSDNYMEKITHAFTYNSKLYKNLVSKRASHVLKQSRAGKNVIYSDADTVWLSDPRPFLIGQCDIWASLNVDISDSYCTGFFAVKSNAVVVTFLQEWTDSLSIGNQLNQAMFNKLIHTSQVRHCRLAKEGFPPGYLSANNGVNIGKKAGSGVVVVHGSDIIGHGAKVKRFKDWGLWYGN